MATLELRLLGGFEARLKTGQTFDLPTRKTKLLLSFLALSPGQAHPREKLASLLWSDRADGLAQHSLRQSLSALRKSWAGAKPGPLRADRRTVSLDPASIIVDVTRFEDLLTSGSVETLHQACALYRGELLEGQNAQQSPFEEWLFYERGRFHDLALQAFERLLNHQRGAGETTAAIETAKRLLMLSPVHEKAHQALMELYAGQGRRAAALEQYGRCRAVLKRELEVEPETRTEELYRAVLQGRTGPSGEREALALPEKPSVAVLPFANMSGDPGQDYFCDGISEDIITALSRFRSLFVIARNSSFAYRGLATDLRQVGRNLGVQHIVEGSVQRSGKRIRITVQLIDAISGNHVWAERYDRDIEDIFAVQDEVTGYIAGHVTMRIDDQRLRAARRRHPESLQAYDYWLRANRHMEARTLNGVAESRQLFERALELDPQFARAHVDLSRSYLFDAHYLAGGTGMQDKFDQAFRHAQTALSLDNADARSHMCLGLVHLFRREFKLASARFELAAKLNPSDADALMHGGLGLTYAGDPATGLELTERAARLNPYGPDWYSLQRLPVFFLAGRYEASFEAYRLLPDLQPDVPAWKAVICMQLGQLGKARGHVDQLIRNVDKIWVGDAPPAPGDYKKHFLQINPLARTETVERLIGSLHKAGLPE